MIVVNFYVTYVLVLKSSILFFCLPCIKVNRDINYGIIKAKMRRQKATQFLSGHISVNPYLNLEANTKEGGSTRVDCALEDSLKQYWNIDLLKTL